MIADPERVSVYLSQSSHRAAGNLIRQDQQDLSDLKCPKSRRLERLRLTGVWFLLKYLLDADFDPQITQITLIFKKLAWLDRLKKWEPMSTRMSELIFVLLGFPLFPRHSLGIPA